MVQWRLFCHTSGHDSGFSCRFLRDGGVREDELRDYLIPGFVDGGLIVMAMDDGVEV